MVTEGPEEYRHLTVPRTARWCMLEPAGDARGTLFALHGYGQLAGWFIRKFQGAADAGWRVVAPEGGHRFYLKGTAGRVGASWMTKEDRLTDIEDYLLFLDTLRHVPGACSGGPQVLLGFSQGVATALRWAALGAGGASSWDAIIAHSGVIPPDLPAGRSSLAEAPALHLVAGLSDPYIDDVEHGFISSAHEWARSGGLADRVHRYTFAGGHEVDPPTVLEVLDRVANERDSYNFGT